MSDIDPGNAIADLAEIVNSIRRMIDPIATDVVAALEAIASNSKVIAYTLEEIRDTLDELAERPALTIDAQRLAELVNGSRNEPVA